MGKKHKKVSTTLNYSEYFLNLASTIAECISISAFTSLIGIPIGIAIAAIGFKICAITARTKKYKSIIKTKNKKKHNKIVLLAKCKLNIIEVLISKALIESVISHDERRNKKFKDLIKFIKDFSLFIK